MTELEKVEATKDILEKVKELVGDKWRCPKRINISWKDDMSSHPSSGVDIFTGTQSPSIEIEY